MVLPAACAVHDDRCPSHHARRNVIRLRLTFPTSPGRLNAWWGHPRSLRVDTDRGVSFRSTERSRRLRGRRRDLIHHENGRRSKLPRFVVSPFGHDCENKGAGEAGWHMARMTGLAVSMLYLGNKLAQAHTLGVAIIEPTRDEPHTAAWILGSLGERISSGAWIPPANDQDTLGATPSVLIDDPHS